MMSISRDDSYRHRLALRDAMGEAVVAALGDPKVVEVMANSDGSVWVERAGEAAVRVGSITSVAADTICRLIADFVGATVNHDHPEVSGTLPETGERFQGMVPPVVDAPCFTIRKRPQIVYTLDDYVDSGVMAAGQATVIRNAVANGDNILVSGGTGSGKTTLVNAVLTEPPFRRQRVVILEDTRELQCAAENKEMLLTKTTEPRKTMTDLLRATLRLRPDRIVIGEVRGGEALDMVHAMNTGHPGSVATVHANSALDAVRRVEDMVGQVALSIPHRSIAGAIDLVVHIAKVRAKPSRQIQSLCRVLGYNAHHGYEMHEL